MSNFINKQIKCLQIDSNDKIQPLYIEFKENIKEKLIPIYDMFKNICDNMEIMYKCKYMKREVITAYYPENSYYSIFYQSDHNTIKTLKNNMASVIINSECYGNAYVVHFDKFNQLYDVDKTTFITCYNNMRLTRFPIIENNLLSDDASILTTNKNSCFDNSHCGCYIF